MDGRDRGFLDAIIADPDSDGIRLVFADWLDETGRGEWGEFIRMQVVGHVNLGLPATARSALFTGIPAGGGAYQKVKADELADGGTGLEVVVFPDEMDELEITIIYRRGFVDEVVADERDFLALAGPLFAVNPVREVRLTDRRPWGPEDKDSPAAAWSWFRRRSVTNPSFDPGGFGHGGDLADELFRFLEGGTTWSRPAFVDYPTERETLDALEKACLAFGREKGQLQIESRKAKIADGQPDPEAGRCRKAMASNRAAASKRALRSPRQRKH